MNPTAGTRTSKSCTAGAALKAAGYSPRTSRAAASLAQVMAKAGFLPVAMLSKAAPCEPGDALRVLKLALRKASVRPQLERPADGGDVIADLRRRLDALERAAGLRVVLH